MKLSNEQFLLLLAAAGLAAYFVYKKLSGAADVVTKPLANFIVGFQGTPASASGEILLPGGAVISAQDVVNGGSYVDAQGNFKWQGSVYHLSARNSDGQYVAEIP